MVNVEKIIMCKEYIWRSRSTLLHCSSMIQQFFSKETGVVIHMIMFYIGGTMMYHVMKCQRVKLETFLPKQKLYKLQNTVGDVIKLAYGKSIGAQVIKEAILLLIYNNYMELLLWT